MSFYPLVNNEDQLKKLDGWLLSVIYRAIKLRAKLLLSHGHDVSTFFPFSCDKNQLLVECDSKVLFGKKLFKMPSFFLVYKALQKGLIEGGIEKTMHEDSNNYDY